jgi:hypothetical protein
VPYFIITDLSSKLPTMSSNERMERLEDMQADDEIEFNPNIFQGFEEKFSGFATQGTKINNNYAMAIDGKKNGSMTIEGFYRLAVHFTSFLPKNIGRGDGKLPAFLFLDVHTSRWNPKALEYLYIHNVHVLFIPSKASIWAQPNDNVINYLTHRQIDEVAR